MLSMTVLLLCTVAQINNRRAVLSSTVCDNSDDTHAYEVRQYNRCACPEEYSIRPAQKKNLIRTLVEIIKINICFELLIVSAAFLSHEGRDLEFTDNPMV